MLGERDLSEDNVSLRNSLLEVERVTRPVDGELMRPVVVSMG